MFFHSYDNTREVINKEIRLLLLTVLLKGNYFLFPVNGVLYSAIKAISTRLVYYYYIPIVMRKSTRSTASSIFKSNLFVYILVFGHRAVMSQLRKHNFPRNESSHFFLLLFQVTWSCYFFHLAAPEITTGPQRNSFSSRCSFCYFVGIELK